MQNTNSSAIFVDDRTGNMIVSRGVNLGKELDRMSKGSRIKIVIPPGLQLARSCLAWLGKMLQSGKGM